MLFSHPLPDGAGNAIAQNGTTIDIGAADVVQHQHPDTVVHVPLRAAMLIFVFAGRVKNFFPVGEVQVLRTSIMQAAIKRKNGLFWMHQLVVLGVGEPDGRLLENERRIWNLQNNLLIFC